MAALVATLVIIAMVSAARLVALSVAERANPPRPPMAPLRLLQGGKR